MKNRGIDLANGVWGVGQEEPLLKQEINNLRPTLGHANGTHVIGPLHVFHCKKIAYKKLNSQIPRKIRNSSFFIFSCFNSLRKEALHPSD